MPAETTGITKEERRAKLDRANGIRGETAAIRSGQFNTMKPLRVEPTPFKWIAWAGITLSGFLTISSWESGNGAQYFFLFWLLLGIFLLTLAGPIEMEEDLIRYTSLYTGRCEIRWDDVEHIEVQTPGGETALVFHGHEKRLAVPGIMYWMGKDKEAMVELFQAQVKERGIKVEPTRRAVWHMPKNTRV